ncbi:MAG: hypothetical protein AAFX39_06555 [Pseudomonadota bacterium]
MGRILKFSLGGLIVVGLLTALVIHGILSGWFVMQRPLAELSSVLEDYVEVHFPDIGDGPFPVVAMFPGCGGFYQEDGTPKPLPPAYRDIALDAGYAVVTVDGFSARGYDLETLIDQVCSGHAYRGAERAQEVALALHTIGIDSRLDDDHVVLAGWSHGGWTVMDALSFDMISTRPHGLADGEPGLFDGLRGVFLVYPYCSFPARTGSQGWRYQAEVTAVLVTEDQLAPEDDCLSAFDLLQTDGIAVDVTVLDGLTHAFDEADTPPYHPRFTYDPEATADMHERFSAFLTQLAQ